MAYTTITKYNSGNYTPAASVPAVYGRPRTVNHIVIHWWGEPAHKPSFRGVVDYLCRPGGNTSAHAVIEAGLCAWIVNGWDSAWHAGHAEGNATGIGLELNPRCLPGDWATAAEVIADLWIDYKQILPLRPHSSWQLTECPGESTGRGYKIAVLYTMAMAAYTAKKAGKAVKTVVNTASPSKPTPVKPAKAPANGIHVVKKGESLAGIAAKYGTTVPALRNLNSYITNPNYLAVGDRVRIKATKAAPKPPKPTKNAVKGSGITWSVEKGDTLWSVATDFYSKPRAAEFVKKIKELNGLNSNELKIGQKLRLPTGIYWNTEKGDTINKIGRRFGVHGDWLVKRNAVLKNTGYDAPLYAGQMLHIG